MTPTLVIGIGNRDRGDDAAGLALVRRLRAHKLKGAVVREGSGAASELLESWRGQERVILIDAASGSGRPGSVRRFEAHEEPLPGSSLRTSTHSWGVVEAIELARSLGQLPRSVVVYAIEGKSFEPGRRLSPEVAKAIERLEPRILRELAPPAPSPTRPLHERP
jgi:hydrogenase maturation protease